MNSNKSNTHTTYKGNLQLIIYSHLKLLTMKPTLHPQFSPQELLPTFYELRKKHIDTIIKLIKLVENLEDLPESWKYYNLTIELTTQMTKSIHTYNMFHFGTYEGKHGRREFIKQLKHYGNTLKKLSNKIDTIDRRTAPQRFRAQLNNKPTHTINMNNIINELNKQPSTKCTNSTNDGTTHKNPPKENKNKKKIKAKEVHKK